MNVFPAPQNRMTTWAAMLAGLVFLAGTPALFGHARLVRSNPPDKAVLDQPPAKVELWFNELLDQGFHSIEVFPVSELKEKKRTNYAAPPVIDPKDRTRVSAELKPVPSGDYIIEWRVLSRDGHSAPGRLMFSVEAPAK